MVFPQGISLRGWVSLRSWLNDRWRGGEAGAYAGHTPARELRVSAGLAKATSRSEMSPGQEDVPSSDDVYIRYMQSTPSLFCC